MAVPTQIYNWAKSSRTHKAIEVIQNFDGGWETWAQVEIALWFAKYQDGPGTRTVLQREENVYGASGQKADFVVTTSITNLGNPTDLRDIVELKCLNNPNNNRGAALKSFHDRLVEDLEKTKKGGGGKFPSATRWVVGVGKASEQELSKLMEDLDFWKKSRNRGGWFGYHYYVPQNVAVVYWGAKPNAV